MYTFTAALAALLSVVRAQDFSTWSPPGPGDVRSPCPGLNALANHGILPHDGKGLTIPTLIKALDYGMNVGADFATVIGAAGILSVPADPLAISFDLNDLDEHNFPIEHDASLSRADYNLNNGNNYSFNQSIFNTVLAFYNRMDSTSIPVAAKAKLNRVQTERARDPEFTYTPQQFVLSYGETALYISVMGDPETGVAPLEYVKIFFEEERLPYAEGWRPPAKQTNLLTLGQMITELYVAAGDVLPEGLEITTNTLKFAFGGYDPITGLLAHIL
ncbi:sterigmatocystin biosynthesis peroxidase stcC [Hyphodiscus hymeniophilus]|uniref:Sterigmatocystin biosynthesis peroxidase stcC n=1 Tax=Hyphodiscus hymeniophilus TaxID=353542 RepID=A0A9P6VLK6_9HELO|nr:sterigmatocystin biosynthesis peroxidase stcC [Hyphodiscus hymeniophilus]